jgi:hypothetical protein
MWSSLSKSQRPFISVRSLHLHCEMKVMDCDPVQKCCRGRSQSRGIRSFPLNTAFSEVPLIPLTSECVPCHRPRLDQWPSTLLAANSGPASNRLAICSFQACAGAVRAMNRGFSLGLLAAYRRLRPEPVRLAGLEACRDQLGAFAGGVRLDPGRNIQAGKSLVATINCAYLL